MANLKLIFQKGVETLFKVFVDAVKTGTYIVEEDNGFDAPTSTSDDIRCIFEKFTAKDVELLTFSKLIQPQDIKGLMPAVDLVNNKMTTQGHVMFGTDKYTVEGHDVDPMEVIYTLLLRKV